MTSNSGCAPASITSAASSRLAELRGDARSVRPRADIRARRRVQPVEAHAALYDRRARAQRERLEFLGREQQPRTDNDNLANPLQGRSQTGANIGINHSFRRRALSELNGVNRKTT
jgi:hypothetical protein